MRLLSAFLIGALFGIGIAISGMANPAKVINFFDIAGSFDPSLIFVMGGAVVTAFIGYRLLFSARQAPFQAAKFALPTRKDIDLPLVGGSAVFGIGWGISGFCPGGAIPALGYGQMEVVYFVLSMAAGIVAAQAFRNRAARIATA